MGERGMRSYVIKLKHLISITITVTGRESLSIIRTVIVVHEADISLRHCSVWE